MLVAGRPIAGLDILAGSFVVGKGVPAKRDVWSLHVRSYGVSLAPCTFPYALSRRRRSLQ